MAIDKNKKIQIKVTIPRELHDKLRALSDRTGLPMSQLMLQATLKEYKEELKEIAEELRQLGVTEDMEID